MAFKLMWKRPLDKDQGYIVDDMVFVLLPVAHYVIHTQVRS